MKKRILSFSKYIKETSIHENSKFSTIDPFSEEDWSEKEDLRVDYIGKKLFCLRGHNDISVGIFTDKNIGGYGIGIRGNYFSEREFKKAIKKEGDSLNRKLYTIDEIYDLIQDMGYDDINYGKKIIKNIIKKNRDNYASADPNLERREGVYVELDEIFD